MSGPRSYLREIRPTLTLAAPIVVGQLSQMLMGVLDSAMIGHAGTVPLAAAAFANNIFNIFYVLGIGLMIPVAILVSRARGAQKRATMTVEVRKTSFIGSFSEGSEPVRTRGRFTW